jgi:hypothetical protein
MKHSKVTKFIQKSRGNPAKMTKLSPPPLYHMTVPRFEIDPLNREAQWPKMANGKMANLSLKWNKKGAGYVPGAPHAWGSNDF